jgi:hypothetical protein
MKALLGAQSGCFGGEDRVGTVGRKEECVQKYQADAALCSDGTCRVRAMSRWQDCLTRRGHV